MNEMRKLMEIIGNVEQMQLQEIREVHGDAYVAAYLYLNSGFGVTKPELAKVLSKAISISYDSAAQIIDAIDAYEDIKDAEEFKHK